MTERWQRELRKLETLQPPSDLWERVTLGPRQPVPRPSPRWQALAPLGAALAVALVIGGLTLARIFNPAGSAAGPGGPWGKAKEVAAAFNTGGFALVTTVSCAAPGDCSAGGYYKDSSGHLPGFVVSETNGTWGTARKLATPRGGSVAAIDSVSCTTPGNCSAGGNYTDRAGNSQAFVVSQTNGTWGAAKEVAGELDGGGRGQIQSVSCWAPGNCSAGGDYAGGTSHGLPTDEQAFVVSETNGAWGPARTVAAALNTSGAGFLTSVSCAAGTCSAGGSYTAAHRQEAFLVNETNGAWGPARTVAAALNTFGQGSIQSISCAAPGNCSAGGVYSTFSSHQQHQQPFVVSETNGTWGPARRVGAGFGNGYDFLINSLSCAAPGNCSAGGYYEPKGHFTTFQAFVISEANGAWGPPRAVAAARNGGGEARIDSVSCAAPGDCSAGGAYDPNDRTAQAFVISEANGTWGPPRAVAVGRNGGRSAVIESVSCATARNCSAGGYYRDSSGRQQAFVVSKP